MATPWRAAVALLAALLLPPAAAAQTSTTLPSPAPQFVTLGTGGGPIIRLKRSHPANALVVNGAVYLFDAGDGVLRQLEAAGLEAGALRAVFLSHHHIDHVGGLPSLLVNRWLFNHHAPLPVWGPRGTEAMLGGIAGAFRPTELAPVTIGGPPKPPIAASIAAHDLAPDPQGELTVYRDENIHVAAISNAHYHFPDGEAARFSRSYAYRIEAGGRSIVYTGDTGWSDRLVEFARSADLLVSEVIDLAAMETVLRAASDLPPGALRPMLAHMQQDHLTPAQVGRLAAAAGVGQIVLTHLAPGMDDEANSFGYVAGIAEHYRGPVIVANDLDRF
jgi:ribonuclease BN (tRNA processing enzyme)